MSYERDKRIFNGNKNSKVENKSNSVDKSTESVDMSIAEFEEYEENVLKKLNDYLSRTNRTEDDINEIYHNYDIIADNNGHDFNVDGLSKIEEFVDNSNDKALYNISYIKEFMSDLASDYSNNLPGWGTEEESEDLEEESENLEEESEDLEDLEDEEIEEIFERDNKKEKKPSKIATLFKKIFTKKDDTELEDEEIFERDNKKEKKPSKIATLFKKIFTKKDDTELEDEEIEEVRERKKFSLKSLFGKKRKNKNAKEVKVGNERNFEELSLHEKLFKYLDGVDYTWKDLSNIISKISVISEDETKTEELHKFLNENKDLSKEEKISKLVYKIIEISGNSKNNSGTLNLNPRSEVIKKFFNINKLDTIPELVSLYNEIVMNDENIDKLYDYIANNIEEAKNADNIISKMNEILGKKMIEKRKDNKVSAEENLNKIEKIRKEIERLEKNKEEIKNIKFISADEDEKSFVKEEPKVVSNIAKEETIKYYDDQIKKLRDQIKEIIANNKYTNENGREISMEERARFDRLDEVQIQIIETIKEQKKINSEFNEAWYGHMGEKVDTELLKRRMILKNKLDTINIKLNLLKKKRDEIINENPLVHPRTM